MADQPLDRRRFLGGAAVAALAVRGPTADPPAAQAGLIVREKEPANLEFPFRSLDGPVTPTNEFFVRTHFPLPAVDPATWRLTVDGEVGRELSLGVDDLKAMAAVSAPMLIECAGNGRANLVPKAKGLLWEAGAVGVAEWTGVRLADVLAKAAVKPAAVEVVLTGADSGALTDDPKTPGAISFERSLPLAKAKRPEVVLAYRMNGKPLTREHGFPLRAVVGGWYGMASVKWLTRVTVTATSFQGFWQTHEYSYWTRDRGRPTQVPVTEVQVKAQIARPALAEAVPAGKAYRVHGAAWAGESQVAKVEVSTDGGGTWAAAKLAGDAVPFAWRLWSFDWAVPAKPGRYRLMARATDATGRTQPAAHDKDRRTYMINFTAPVEVEVG